MKARWSSGRIGAFTLLELLCVIAIVAILMALLLPALNNTRARAKRVQCISQLRQVGVAFHAFAHDHNGHFPMRLPASAGGTAESAMAAQRVAGEFSSSYRHLQALSNELVTPRLLVCPADERKPAIHFASLENQNLSYFVGINADYAQPNSILAGDRNLTNDWAGSTRDVVRLGANFALRWTFELHRFKGNLLFADCRVEEKNTAMLLPALNQFPPIAELAIPGTQPTGPGTPTSSGALMQMQPPPATKSPGALSPPGREPPHITPAAENATLPQKPAPAFSGNKNSPPPTNLPASTFESGSSNPGSMVQQRGPFVSQIPARAQSAASMLAGKWAAVFYVLFLALLISLLAFRLWENHKRSEAHSDPDGVQHSRHKSDFRE